MPFTIGCKGGKNRRVLSDIKEYPTPQEFIQKIKAYRGKYKTHQDFYTKRDRALAVILFICQLRKSEAHRLTKQQFKPDPFRVVSVKLSKAEKRSQTTGQIITRKDAYRKEILLPLTGKLGEYGQIVQEYLELIKKPDTRLFPFKDECGRTNQIIGEMLNIPPHWERAFGENLLYELFDYDLIAVANYVQVDPRTLSKYIHRTPKKYLKKLK